MLWLVVALLAPGTGRLWGRKRVEKETPHPREDLGGPVLSPRSLPARQQGWGLGKQEGVAPLRAWVRGLHVDPQGPPGCQAGAGPGEGEAAGVVLALPAGSLRGEPPPITRPRDPAPTDCLGTPEGVAPWLAIGQQGVSWGGLSWD